MFEHLSPDAIETISQIVLGVIVLLASLLGINLGRNRNKNAEAEGEVHEIKGAIISDVKAQEILRVTEENTRSNMELIAAIHLLREGVKDARQEIKDTMREFRDEMRYLLRSTQR